MPFDSKCMCFVFLKTGDSQKLCNALQRIDLNKVQYMYVLCILYWIKLIYCLYVSLLINADFPSGGLANQNYVFIDLQYMQSMISCMQH